MFKEDACGIHKDNVPDNLVVLRLIVVNLLGGVTTSKRGIKARQKRAGRNEDFLDHLLTNQDRLTLERAAHVIDNRRGVC